MPPPVLSERRLRWMLILTAGVSLLLGLLLWTAGFDRTAHWCWFAGVVPVAIGLLRAMVLDLMVPPLAALVLVTCALGLLYSLTRRRERLHP